jgi:hypothetical protein
MNQEREVTSNSKGSHLKRKEILKKNRVTRMKVRPHLSQSPNRNLNQGLRSGDGGRGAGIAGVGSEEVIIEIGV